MPKWKRLRTKITLVGDTAVGKTSLIRRFVLDAFDDSYSMTLGTKVSKKVVEVGFPRYDMRVRVDMGIWDIMGQYAFRDLLKEAYFTGSQGILAVADVTRPPSLDGLHAWIGSVTEVTGPLPIVIVGNKADMGAKDQVTRQGVEALAKELESDFFLTSAKTGENVERAFKRLGWLVARAQLGLV